MKRISLVFLAVLMKLYSNAEYYPISVDNHTWKITNFGLVLFHYSDFIDGDTVINNTTYHKLFQQMYGSESIYQIGLIRDDIAEQKVYSFDGIQDRLLYDFGVDVGDVVDVFSMSGQNNVTVQSIETVVVNGTSRKKITVMGEFSNGIWIEGIGSTRGVMDPVLGPIVDYFPTLACFYADDLLNWDNPEYDSVCGQTVAVDEALDISGAIAIYPNPAAEYVTLNSEMMDLNRIEMYDALGNKCFSAQLSNRLFMKFDVSGLSNGVYNLVAYRNNATTLTQKLIISK